MIWLTGCKGMLGTAFMKMLESCGMEFTGTDMDLDITDNNTVRDFTRGKNIRWIINCAAYTAVDNAEDERDKAFSINSEGVKNLGIIAREINATVIHFSTDYVFNGISARPYMENDAVDPVNVYGAGKLQGEINLADECRKYFIFRISWLYGEYGKNFVYTMLRLFNSSSLVRVVNDQYGSPTYTGDIAAFIISLVKDNSAQYGIYNYSCDGIISWYDFAKQILESGKRLGLVKNDPVLEGISSAEYKTKARRPDYSYMSKEKVINTFDITIPSWRDSLERFLSGLAENPGRELY